MSRRVVTVLYEEIKGGLNRMTLDKFMATMDRSGLEAQYLEINRNERPIAKALNILSRVPGVREFFTFSVHSVWCMPARDALASAPGRDDLVASGSGGGGIRTLERRNRL